MESNTDFSLHLPPDDVAAIDQLGQTYQAFRAELGKIIIGQDLVIEQLAICLFARGHALLMGVPGLAKTLLVSSVAQTFDLTFSRIQFTPDLMPADITGTDIIQETGVGGRREFEFAKGPVFAHIVLADEINRAPAKAQLDRFMFLIEVDYPSAEEEKRIARETTGSVVATIDKLLDGQKVLAYQQLVRRVPVPEHIYEYAVKMVRKTRPGQPEAPQWIRDTVGWGAGPRAVQYLILGAKSRAALRGAYMASLEDLEAVASSVLTHRVITNFAAESQGMNSKKIVERLIKEMRES